MPNFPPNYAEQEKYYASEEYQNDAKAAIANNQKLPSYEDPESVSNSEVTSQPPRSSKSKKQGGILRYPLEALTGTTDYLTLLSIEIDLETQKLLFLAFFASLAVKIPK